MGKESGRFHGDAPSPYDVCEPQRNPFFEIRYAGCRGRHSICTDEQVDRQSVVVVVVVVVVVARSEQRSMLNFSICRAPIN
jgi:hypothetical protein